LLNSPNKKSRKIRVIALRKAIIEGLESGRALDLDPNKHLASLKEKRRADG
jgi:antitoxin ParD1/3/4